MILFGVNFNLYYLMIARRFRSAFSSRELWIYGIIIVVTTFTVCANVFNVFDYTGNISDAIRHSVFQVASFMTTTGYSTVPSSSSLNLWPTLSKTVLFLLMFVGGCAGSTAGGLKVSRWAILYSNIKKEVKRVLHPRNANVAKFEGKTLSDEALHSTTSYFALYIFIIGIVFVLLCFDSCPDLTIESNLTVAVSCFNNIGPAYGVPLSGMYMYNYFSKIVLTLAMLLGRLEIYPILLVLSPNTWTKK